MVAHEVNHIAMPLVQEGIVQFAIARNPVELLGRAISLVNGQIKPGTGRLHHVDFVVYTRFHLPKFEMD